MSARCLDDRAVKTTRRRELRLAAAGDREAAERYERLALLTTDDAQRADYQQRARESRASCGRNLSAAHAPDGGAR